MMTSPQSRDFPDQVFLKGKSKMTGDCFFLKKFPRRSVDGKHLMRFQSENAVFRVKTPFSNSFSEEWTGPKK